MGLTVAAMGLLGLGFLYILYGSDPETVSTIHGFGMGASTVALFSRVGGGIFTKSADVGADLVGKVEKDIPEMIQEILELLLTTLETMLEM
jgi:K(+)-stimulated pyrophosphate-energized sodium pump